MSLLQEVGKLTRKKAKSNAKRLIVTASSLSLFFTLVFYFTGIIQQDPLYQNLPLYFSLPLTALNVFNAVGVMSLVILYLKSFGECSVPKITRGYWKTTYRFIFPEQFKKNISTDIWGYVKLHRKHDPLYQADLEKLNDKIESNNKQHQKDMEILLREIRVKNLALDKLRSLKNQAERERDEARLQVTKLTNLVRKLLTTIFKLELIIKKLKGE